VRQAQKGRYASLRDIRYRRRKLIVKVQAACFVGLLCVICGITTVKDSIEQSGGLAVWSGYDESGISLNARSEGRRLQDDPDTEGTDVSLCADSILNGDETDVDCGGGSCEGCENDKKCMLDTDCAGKCEDKVCVTDECAPDDDGGEEAESLFPEDMFTLEERKKGAIILHIICIMYTFVGIAIVCDDYFAMALELICDKLDLAPDVAGATFMAAGGSAPELATSILGVFVATSDIGFGTIVGSAVFNVMFVIAACCFATAGRNLELSWWPLIRDCSYYCASIMVLVGCVSDQEITLLEGFVLLGCYGGYIYIMYKNEILEAAVTKKVLASGDNIKNSPEGGVRKVTWTLVTHPLFDFIIYVSIFLNIVAIFEPQIGDADIDWSTANLFFNILFATEMLLKIHAFHFFGYWQDPGNAFDGMLVLLIVFELFQTGSGDGGALTSARFLKFFRAIRTLRTLRIFKLIIRKTGMAPVPAKAPVSSPQSIERKLSVKNFSHVAGGVAPGTSPNAANGQQRGSFKMTEGEDLIEAKKMKLPPISHKSGQVVPAELALPAATSAPTTETQPTEAGASSNGDIETAKDNLEGPRVEEDNDDDEGPADPFDVPEDAAGKVKWLFLLPYTFGMWATIPNCGKEGKDHLFGVTFAMSIAWIGFISYFMVWMATLLGETIGIRESIMGITLIAAGTSIPDLISSVIVARQGYGDMAVSSSIGSNIFDILIGLPVPWILYTGINYPATVEIGSAGITFMVILLFLMVGMTCGSIYISGWKLTVRLGVCMVFMYFVFLTFSVLLEYGVILNQC